MSEAFAIRSYDAKYPILSIDSQDLVDFFPEEIPLDDILDFNFVNLEISPYWKGQIITGFDKAEEVESTLFDINICMIGAISLSERAFEALEKLLRPYGEFLPIQIEDEALGNHRYYIYNCLSIIEDTKLPPKVFKSREKDNCSTIYCTEEIKNVIDETGLEGVKLFSTFF